MARRTAQITVQEDDRIAILIRLGKLAQAKYDEFIVQGGANHGYDLEALKGCLQFAPDVEAFENVYWLEGRDEHWTKVANYFEYGTGLYNSKRAGKYHAGYIKPVVFDYMHFLIKKGGKHWVITEKVKGVRPILAMEKTKKYIEHHRDKIQKSMITEAEDD